MSDADQVARGLAELIRSERPGVRDLVLSDLSQIVGGNSAEIWRFDARWIDRGGEGGGKFILRRAAENDFESAGRVAEFRLLKAIGDKGARSPQVFLLDADGSRLGRPAMIMERAEGEADRNLLRDDNRLGLDAAARRALAEDMAGALAAIQSIDADALELDPAMRAAADPAADQLARADAEIARFEAEPMPELRLASLWLLEHLPTPPARRTLVHADFRPANMLVADGAISAVLDWEFAHVGDPAEDVGYYLTACYAAEHFVPGVWEPRDFLARYAAASGAAPDIRAVYFWSVFAMYKLASLTMAALSSAVAGDHSRLAPSARFMIDPLLRSIVDEPQWVRDAA